MLAAFGYLAVGGYTNVRGALLALAAAYVIASVFALRGSRWAVAISVAASALLTLRWLPVVVMNTWMFISGHELYQDSPGTIFIVASYAIVFAIPSTMILALFILKRKELWLSFRSQLPVSDA
jgi:hypothetical protein